jgi:hypothetical protein
MANLLQSILSFDNAKWKSAFIKIPAGPVVL